MSKEVEIQALKPFNKTPQGDLCEVGEVFPVNDTRADELERLGLATRDIKSATVAETQAAPKPSDKAAPKPKTKG